METVNDIIREIRDVARLYIANGNESRSTFEMLDSYADRLDRANKRDLQSIVDAGEIDMRTAMDEVTRLRSALKPVLQCPVCDDFSPIQQAKYTMRAVADAIHVYTGGAK